MIPISRRILVVCGIVAATLATVSARADEPHHPIAETDLFRFLWAGDPQIAPDSSQVVFVRVTVDRDKDDYETSIWAAPVGGGEPRRLTNGPRDVWPRWSPDGSRLLFLRRPEGEGKPKPSQVYLMLLAGGEPRALTDLREGASAPAWSPDSKAIAFLSGTTPDDLAKLAKARAKQGPPERESDVRIITRADYRLDNAGYRDSKHPSHLWVVASPASVDEKPTPKRLTSGPFEESDAAWSPDGKKLYFVSTRDLETDLNAKLFAGLDLRSPEEIRDPSFDGLEITAWVQKPPGFDPSKKYPLILNIHGGPHAAYGYTFSHEFQWMAAKGYVVLYPNPRGSSSYGAEFGNVIQYRYPGDDHKDLMAGVDDLIRRGYIDPKRLGVTGGSGGGILTNWAITQTNRFAAAVAQRSIADWSSFWYTTDCWTSPCADTTFPAPRTRCRHLRHDVAAASAP